MPRGRPTWVAELFAKRIHHGSRRRADGPLAQFHSSDSTTPAPVVLPTTFSNQIGSSGYPLALPVAPRALYPHAAQRRSQLRGGRYPQQQGSGFGRLSRAVIFPTRMCLPSLS